MIKLFPNGFRIASLSMMPDEKLCPWSKNAGCFDLCLKTSGRALMFDSISVARQNKTDYYHTDKTEFLNQLRKELGNFEKCIHLSRTSTSATRGLYIHMSLPS